MNPDDLDRRLRRFRRRYGAPAVGAAIVAGDDITLAVAGRRVRGGAGAVEATDRWHIGSCGKAITAAYYARLVERGRAEWTTTIPELFAELGATLDPGWRDVAVEQLLTHRAGLPGNLEPEAMAAAYQDGRPLTEQRAEVVARALRQPPRDVGSFRYSNLGYVVVGAAIERLTGLAWEDSLRAELLDPLGLTSAGFGAPIGHQTWGHRPRTTWVSPRGPRWLAVGRGPAVDPGNPGSPNPYADNPPVLGPAGRLHLSLADWARFVGSFLVPGNDLLEPSSVARITTPPPGPGPRQGMGWAVPAGRAARGIGLGQQGSNTFWVATALVTTAHDRAALVVCNDGRRRLLAATARLAASLLDS